MKAMEEEKRGAKVEIWNLNYRVEELKSDKVHLRHQLAMSDLNMGVRLRAAVEEGAPARAAERELRRERDELANLVSELHGEIDSLRERLVEDYEGAVDDADDDPNFHMHNHDGNDGASGSGGGVVDLCC